MQNVDPLQLCHWQSCFHIMFDFHVVYCKCTYIEYTTGVYSTQLSKNACAVTCARANIYVSVYGYL